MVTNLRPMGECKVRCWFGHRGSGSDRKCPLLLCLDSFLTKAMVDDKSIVERRSLGMFVLMNSILEPEHAVAYCTLSQSLNIAIRGGKAKLNLPHSTRVCVEYTRVPVNT